MARRAQPLHALTGFRFVAALLVFVHHVGGRFGLPKEPWSLGSLAVSFFFVLSGFILTYVYSERLQRDGLKKFYFTRWARIWPLHFVCLLIFLLTLGSASQFANIEGWGKLITNSLLLQSWVPSSPWVFSFNGVAWSISTEFFFYLMFPLFLLGGQKKFWIKYVGLLCITALVLFTLNNLSAIASLQTHVDFYRVGHVNPVLRLPEFCTGMAAGFVYLNRNKLTSASSSIWPATIKELACFAAVIGCWWTVHHYHLVHAISRAQWGGEIIGSWFRVTYTAAPFAVLIYVFANSRGLFGRLMSTRLFVFLGEISFAFYMIHFVVILSVRQSADSFGDLSPWLVALCCLGITIAFSTLLYKLVEMPAKAALLSAYNRRLNDSANVLARYGFSFARSWTAASTTLILAVSTTTLVLCAQQHQPIDNAFATIIRQTPMELRRTSFGHQIELLGFETESRSQGVELAMIWRKTAPLTRRRFVHVCDASGKIIGYGRRNEELFQNAEIGTPFVDRVFIKNETLRQGLSIGVGFHAPGQGMAIVNKGPRSMRFRRLDILPAESYKSLIGESGERIGRRDSSNERKQR